MTPVSSSCEQDPEFPLRRVISGGQTGVDRGALSAALAAGFPSGGWCPAGRRAEDGAIPAHFPVQELSGGYRARTIRNLEESDGTLILFERRLDGGTELTRDECERRGRPWLAVDAADHAAAEAASLAAAFIDGHDIATLNVAGPRASKWAEGANYAEAVIGELIERAMG